MRGLLAVFAMALLPSAAGKALICVSDSDCRDNTACVQLAVDGKLLAEGVCLPARAKYGEVCKWEGGLGTYAVRECEQGLVCVLTGYFADFKTRNDEFEIENMDWLSKIRTCQRQPAEVGVACSFNGVEVKDGLSARVNGKTILCDEGRITALDTPCEELTVQCSTNADCSEGSCVDTVEGKKCSIPDDGIHPPVNGTCAARADDVDLCSSDNHCGSEQYCDTAALSCKMRQKIGLLCHAGVPCEHGTACTGFGSAYWGEYNESAPLFCEPERRIGQFCGYNPLRNNVPTPSCEANSLCLPTPGIVFDWFKTCQSVTRSIPLQGERPNTPIPKLDGLCHRNTDCPGNDQFCLKFLNLVDGDTTTLEEGICKPKELKQGEACSGSPEVYPHQAQQQCPHESNCELINVAKRPVTGVPSVLDYAGSLRVCMGLPVVSHEARDCLDQVSGNTTAHGSSVYSKIDGQCTCYNGVFECNSGLKCVDSASSCCNVNGDCGVNEKCIEKRRECAPLQPVGSPCDQVLKCESELWCNHGKCDFKLFAGTVCNVTESCHEMLACKEVNEYVELDVCIETDVQPVPLTVSPRTIPPSNKSDTPLPPIPEPTDATTQFPTPVPPSPRSPQSRVTSAGIFTAIAASVAFIAVIAFYCCRRGVGSSNGDFVEMSAM